MTLLRETDDGAPVRVALRGEPGGVDLCKGEGFRTTTTKTRISALRPHALTAYGINLQKPLQ